MAAVLAEAKKRVEKAEAKVEAAVTQAVHELADEAVAHSPESVKKYAGLFEFDSPVVITLVTVCTLIHAVTAFIWSDFTLHIFSCHPFPYTSLVMDPLRTWWRLVSHTLGHSSWQHLSGNASLILLVGPWSSGTEIAHGVNANPTAWVDATTGEITLLYGRFDKPHRPHNRYYSILRANSSWGPWRPLGDLPASLNPPNHCSAPTEPPTAWTKCWCNNEVIVSATHSPRACWRSHCLTMHVCAPAPAIRTHFCSS